jgi:hypothetical protein
MSQEDLWKAIGRSRLDLDFSGQLITNPEKVISEAGYKLDASELRQLQQMLMTPDGQAMGPGKPPPELMKLRFQIAEKGVEVVKKTFDRAASTYSTITWMNRIMFATGIGLFLFAAFFAAYSKESKVYSLLFGGMGATSFIALFMLGPIEKTQKALSNLVQVEVVFMNYFDQLNWWEMIASIPKGMPPGPDPEHIERASAGLQQRTLEAVLRKNCRDAIFSTGFDASVARLGLEVIKTPVQSSLLTAARLRQNRMPMREQLDAVGAARPFEVKAVQARASPSSKFSTACCTTRQMREDCVSNDSERGLPLSGQSSQASRQIPEAGNPFPYPGLL